MFHGKDRVGHAHGGRAVGNQHDGFVSAGIVQGFDNFTIVLDSDGKQNLVYKHAVSTIVPSRPISMSEAMEKASEETKSVE